MSHSNFSLLFNLICDGIGNFENVPFATHLPNIVSAILDLRLAKDRILIFVDSHVTSKESRAKIEEILIKIANDEVKN